MSVPANRSRKRTYLRAEHRRAQILDVAKQVFAERTFQQANIADICRAARIGRGTLYQYFDNKHAVLLALLEGIGARIDALLSSRPRVAELRGVGRTPLPAMVAFCRSRLREVLDAVFVDEATLRLVLREAGGDGAAADAALAAIDARLLRAIEDDLRAAQRSGVLRRFDVRIVARYILGGIEKIVRMALAAEERIDLDAIVEHAVDLELFGLLDKGWRRS